MQKRQLKVLFLWLNCLYMVDTFFLSNSSQPSICFNIAGPYNALVEGKYFHWYKMLVMQLTSDPRLNASSPCSIYNLKTC